MLHCRVVVRGAFLYSDTEKIVGDVLTQMLREAGDGAFALENTRTDYRLQC